MASKQLEHSLPSAINDISIAFSEAEKAIRRSKAAEYRLNTSKKQVQGILRSLRNDVLIEIDFNQSNSDDMLLMCNWEPQDKPQDLNLNDSGIVDHDQDTSVDILEEI